MVGRGRHHVTVVVRFEFRVTQLHGSVKVFGFDSSSDRFSDFDRLHQVRSFNFVFPDGNDRRRRGRRCVQDCVDRFYALDGSQPTIIEASLPTALGMTENCNASVKFDAVGQEIFHLAGRYLCKIDVVGPL